MTAPLCTCARHADNSAQCRCECPDSLHGLGDWPGLAAVTVCETS